MGSMPRICVTTRSPSHAHIHRSPDDRSVRSRYHVFYAGLATYPVGDCMHQPPVTYHDIIGGLQQLGVVPGAMVEVHSSLSAFGWVEDGAPTVITALMDVLTPDGTIIMSAYPVSPAVPLTDEDHDCGVTWKVRKLSLDSSDRQRPDVAYGSDFFRTSAWGRDAEWHCTGYDGLLAVDGWCLLLGVGIDRCSSMHAAEYVPLPSDITACWAIPL